MEMEMEIEIEMTTIRFPPVYREASNDWCDICGKSQMPLVESTDKESNSFMMACIDCIELMRNVYQRNQSRH